MLYQAEADALKASHWPRCDQLAQALSSHGAAAGDALLYASRSRTHHVRSACLRALASVAPERAKERAQELLVDKAYEVRETAAKVLGVPIPQ